MANSENKILITATVSNLDEFNQKVKEMKEAHEVFLQKLEEVKSFELGFETTSSPSHQH